MAGYIELYNLGKTYQTPRGPAVIVQDFNLNMHDREVVALIGHSGCGKSTVLSMVAGLLEPTQGSVVVALREIDGPGPDRGIVFQSPSLLPWMTAYENVKLGVDRVFPHATKSQRDAVIRHHLASVGLEHALSQRACDLSQGMQQRVGIARAISLSPKMLLLDEPFGMLDSLTRMELQEMLLSLLDVSPCPTLMVTHDVDEALFMADRVVMMTTGPSATIGKILDVPFARPRRRHDVLEHPDYYSLREELITFLEDQHSAKSRSAPATNGQTPAADGPPPAGPSKNGTSPSNANMPASLPKTDAKLMSEPKDASPLVHLLLAEQSQLTAVERFSQRHASLESSLHRPLYQDLIPLTDPSPGEQYAFAVDLDTCSGCKACVTACHEANGLEDDETWRDVGLLVGGYDDFSFLQHVTTACHHCLDPACQSGCPVNAYDKDPHTGIVRHLDDQCIGCQYCLWTCPYEVPRYSKSKGIVRKCDMCRQRLAAHDAPACVQSCPNQAIRIEIVSAEAVQARVHTGPLVDRSPDSRITRPTTRYSTRETSPFERTSADEKHSKPDHAHWPLVVMLVLTQSAVGLLLVDSLVRWLAPSSVGDSVRLTSAIVSGILFVVGMHLVILHLGRPQFAFRAFLGWRTSWLSREVIAFGAFVAVLSAYIGVLLWNGSTSDMKTTAEVGAVVMGLSAACCSAMIYIATRRVNWSPIPTVVRFAGTLAGMGLFVWAVTVVLAGSAKDLGGPSAMVVLAATVLMAKLVAEAGWNVFGASSVNEERRRSTRVLLGPLITAQRIRVLCTWAALVIMLIVAMRLSGETADSTTKLLTAAGLVLAVTGEILERSLYFRAVGYRGMPGVLSR